MKSKETEKTLLKCFDYATLSELPNVLDETTKHWSLAVALVERTSLGEDYVIVKNYRGKPYPLRTFSTLNFQIKKIKAIYPYKLYEDSFLPKMKTMGDVQNYLLRFYKENELKTSEGKLDKEKIKGLLIERSIKETNEMMVRSPKYIPKPIKIVKTEEEDKTITTETKEEITKETENEKATNTDSEESKETIKETEPKRKAGRPSKKDKSE